MAFRVRSKLALWQLFAAFFALLVVPAASAQQSATSDTIKISATLSADYGRIVFYGSLDAYDVRLVGDKLLVHFGHPVTTDPAVLTESLGELVTSATLQKNNTLAITLKNPDYIIRKFKEQDYAGVDLLFSQKREPQQKQADAKKTKEKEKDKTKAPKEKAEKGSKPASIIPKNLATSKKGDDKKDDAKKDDAKTATKEATDKQKFTPLPKDKVEKKVPKTAQNRYSPSKLMFDFKSAVGAAVFSQNNITWVIFDKPFVADTAKITNTGQMVAKAEQLENRYYTVLKLTHPKGVSDPRVTVKRNDFDWIIDISDQPDTPPANIPPVTSESKSLISLVFVQVLKTGEPLYTINPQTGHRQVIVPVQSGDTGMAPDRTYVDFDLPQTHQGVVIELKRDDLITKIVRDGIRVTSQLGLNIFAARDNLLGLRARLGASGKQAPEQIKSILPFNREETLTRVLGDRYAERTTEIQHTKQEAEKTLILPDEDITPWRHMLENDVRDAAPGEKSMKRLNLADFYFAEGLYPEALGELNYAAIEDPKLNESKMFRLRMAALDFLTERYEEAEALLKPLTQEFTPKDGLRETELLRWANNRLIRPRSKQIIDEELPFDLLNHYDAYLQDYPPHLRHKLALLAANYWLDKEVDKQAQQIFDTVSDDKPEHDIVNRLQLVEAKIAEHEGEIDRAMEIYDTVGKEVDDREARAWAGYDSASLGYERNLVPVESTIKKLESLNYVWRGDDLELKVLGMTGQLYAESGNYLEGLRTWKVLVTNFPDTQEALYTAGKMKQIFIGLFDEDRAFEIKPLQALATFFEFRELTPVGEQGDRIVRKLVDYFISADLLENAAAILTHQVRFRSTGEEQFKLALKLASVHLQNHRPDLALEVMEFVPREDIPENLLKERTLVMARALLEQKKYYETLQLLADMDDKAADNIRLDVLFEMRNWFGIMRIVEPRLKEILEAPQHMKERQANEIIMLALAYANQQDRPKLLALRKSFLTDIPMRGKRTVFDYITNDPGKVDYRELTETVQIEDMGEFLTQNIFWPGKEWAAIVRTMKPIVANYNPTKENPLTFDQKEHILQLATATYMMDPSKSVKPLRDLEKQFADVKFGGEFHHVFTDLTRVGDAIPIDAFNPPFTVKDIGAVVEKYKPFFEKDTLITQDGAAPAKPGETAAPSTSPEPKPQPQNS